MLLLGVLLNYMVPDKVFVWVTSIATFGAIWTWLMILLAQLKFRKSLSPAEQKNLKYRMFPVATSTGAIRLEDQKAGAVWLQLGNKSMLMNQKLGQRLADECMSPQQVAVAESLKLNPAQSVLGSAAPVPAPQPGVATK